MGSMVCAVATVHTPMITGMPDQAPVEVVEKTMAGFQVLGKEIRESRPDVIVLFTSEHVVNLTPRFAPPFMVGVGPTYPVVQEPFALPDQAFLGDPQFARELVVALNDAGVDAGHALELRVDHGTVLPLHLMGLLGEVPAVVVLINSLFAPLPPIPRCYQLGQAVAGYVASDACPKRVALVATGGLSHAVGEAKTGMVDDAFDHAFIEALQRGDDALLLSLTTKELSKYGNGTQELRNWVALRGAVPDWQARTVTQQDGVPGWGTGVYQVVWGPTTANASRQSERRALSADSDGAMGPSTAPDNTNLLLDLCLYDICRGPQVEAFHRDPRAVVARYGLSQEAQQAVLQGDVATLARLHAHPMLTLYLSRKFGMPQEEYLAVLRTVSK